MKQAVEKYTLSIQMIFGVVTRSKLDLNKYERLVLNTNVSYTFHLGRVLTRFMFGLNSSQKRFNEN